LGIALALEAGGKGVACDSAAAFRWMQAAAASQIAMAQWKLGSYYEKGFGVGVDRKKAVELYALAAEQGHPSAQFSFGTCLRIGLGVDINLKEAERMFSLAAQQGEWPAYYEWGCLCESRPSPDLKQAFLCFRAGASHDHRPSQFKLGCCYAEGRGVEVNDYEAVKFITLAASNHYVPAQVSLAEFFERGLHVEKNMQQSLSWYLLAAREGFFYIYLYF
jgi:TPR repeat protein